MSVKSDALLTGEIARKVGLTTSANHAEIVAALDKKLADKKRADVAVNLRHRREAKTAATISLYDKVAAATDGRIA